MSEKEMKDFAARAAAFLGDETIADEVIAARNTTKKARSFFRGRTVPDCERTRSVSLPRRAQGTQWLNEMMNTP